MSWLYLPEQVVVCSPPNTCSDSERSATSKTQPIQSRSSRPASEMASSMMPPSGATCAPSTETPGVESWISFLRASRASRGQPEETSTEPATPATCGLIPFALLERSGQVGFSWKTPQCSFEFLTHTNLLLTLSKSWETWPLWGTWDLGAAYQRPPWDWTTNGNGCGLLPTPVARDGSSFYVCTMKTALRVMRTKPLRQLHWCQFGVVYHDLSKGWANPQFSELLMDWPIGWTGLQPLERARFQSWLQQHGGCSHNE